MKQLTICVIAAALAMTVIQSCKTTEANYRAAYEQAVARRKETGVEGTIYDKTRRQAATTKQIVNGDTIAVKRERVKPVEADKGEKLADAYAIAAQFKQIFNARSLRDRLKDSGYEGATLLVTGEPLYYVAAGSGTVSEMDSLCKVLTNAGAIAVRPPYPLVLEPVK